MHFFAILSNLSSKEKLLWNQFFVKTVYTTFGVFGGIYVRCFDNVGPYSLTSKSGFSYMLVLGHLAFFIFEFGLQIYYDVRNKSIRKDTQVHHILSLFGYLMCAYYDLSHSFFCTCFLLEMIVPLQCVCWVLKKAEKEYSFLWRAISLLYIHLFHIRSVLEFIIVYELLWYFEEGIKAPLILAYQIAGSIVFTLILTPTWIYSDSKRYFSQILSIENGKKRS